MPDAVKCRFCGERLPQTAEARRPANPTPPIAHEEPPTEGHICHDREPTSLNHELSINEEMVQLALEKMSLKDTEDLRSIVEADAGDTWTKEAVEAARRVLANRPPDTEHSDGQPGAEPAEVVEEGAAYSLQDKQDSGRFAGHWAVVLLAMLWLVWTVLIALGSNSSGTGHSRPGPALFTLLPAIGLLQRRKWGLVATAIVSLLLGGILAFSARGSDIAFQAMGILFLLGSLVIAVNRLVCAAPTAHVLPTEDRETSSVNHRRRIPALTSFVLVWLFSMAAWSFLSIYAPTALLRAAASEDYRLASLLARIPFLVNQSHGQNGTPLFQAAQRGDQRMAELLIRRGADVNQGAAVSKEELIAEIAARMGIDTNLSCPEKEEELKEKGVDLDAAVVRGTSITPLAAAIQTHHPSLVRLLVDNGADVNKRLLGVTPLHIAAAYGYSEEVALLVAKGADVNARNNGEMTPLHLAAQAGKASVVRLLLAYGADPTLRDTQGNSALGYAVLGDHHEVARLLREGSRPTR